MTTNNTWVVCRDPGTTLYILRGLQDRGFSDTLVRAWEGPVARYFSGDPPKPLRLHLVGRKLETVTIFYEDSNHRGYTVIEGETFVANYMESYNDN